MNTFAWTDDYQSYNWQAMLLGLATDFAGTGFRRSYKQQCGMLEQLPVKLQTGDDFFLDQLLPKMQSTMRNARTVASEATTAHDRR